MFLATHPAIAYTVLQGSKHGVQTKYWSYFRKKSDAFCEPCALAWGRLARTYVFFLGLTRASSEYMGKGKCASFFMYRRQRCAIEEVVNGDNDDDRLR